jgi:carboxypeptidase family protein
LVPASDIWITNLYHQQRRWVYAARHSKKSKRRVRKAPAFLIEISRKGKASDHSSHYSRPVSAAQQEAMMVRSGRARSQWLWAWLVVGTLSMSSTAGAQVTRNGAIVGTITDNTGAVLPGVTITVTSDALQVKQIVRVSEADGNYQVPDLPSGTYKVTYELSGFTTLVREGITLSTSFVAKVDVVLRVATLAETVTVTGESPLIDVTSTSGGSTVTQRELTSVPVTLNPTGVLSLVGGVIVNRTLPSTSGNAGTNLGGGPITYGQQVRMGLWLEGIKAVQSESPDYPATDEVDVKSYGNTADVDLPGAVISIVYKSGGNQYHGRLSAEGQTDKLQSSNIDAHLQAIGITASNAPKYTRKAGADLGGRIIPNKLWFYGAYNWEDSLRGLTGFAQSPGPDGVYLTADDVPGYPWTAEKSVTTKFSYQAAERHKFIGYYEKQFIYDEDKTGSRLIPHEAGRFSITYNRQDKIEWQGVLNTSLLANMMVGQTGYSIIYRPHVAAGYGDLYPAPVTPCRFYRDTGLYTGNGCGGFVTTASSGSAGASWLDRSPQKKQVSGTLTYDPRGSFLGTHDVKAGFLYLPGTLTVNVPDTSIDNEYMLVYDKVGGVYKPTEFWAADVPVNGVSHENQAGIFTTDEWKMSRRLTVNAGVRWDHAHAWVPPQVKLQGKYGLSGSFPQVEIATWSAFAPHLSGAFDVAGDGRTVVKGTFGMFNHAEPNNFGNPITFTSPFQKNSPSQYHYKFNDLNGNNDYDPGEVNLDINGPDFLSVAGPSNNVVNPNLKMGRTNEMTGSIEREVMKSVSVRALYVYKKIYNETGAVTFINVLRPYSVYDQVFTRRDPGPDGIIGTADDGGMVNVYDYNPAYRGANFVATMIPNVPGNRTDSFNNIELRMTKRPGTGHWYVNASFLATKNHRWIEAIAETPNSNYFPLDQTWDESATVAGGIDLPGDLQVSTLYQGFSGQRGSRTVIYRAADPAGGPAFPSSSTITLRSDAFGSWTTPFRNLTNLRVTKRVSLGSRKVAFNVDVYNIFNSNVAYTQQFQAGPTFGQPLTIAQPRVARFSTRFDF